MINDRNYYYVRHLIAKRVFYHEDVSALQSRPLPAIALPLLFSPFVDTGIMKNST